MRSRRFGGSCFLLGSSFFLTLAPNAYYDVNEDLEEFKYAVMFEGYDELVFAVLLFDIFD